MDHVCELCMCGVGENGKVLIFMLENRVILILIDIVTPMTELSRDVNHQWFNLNIRWGITWSVYKWEINSLHFILGFILLRCQTSTNLQTNSFEKKVNLMESNLLYWRIPYTGVFLIIGSHANFKIKTKIHTIERPKTYWYCTPNFFGREDLRRNLIKPSDVMKCR